MSKDALSEAAKAMSAKGAAKGGKARARSLTPEERSEIAKRAAESRWADQRTEPAGEAAPEPEVPDEPEPAKSKDGLPYSVFRGTLKMGDLDMECHVLNDFQTRVLTQREMVRVLTGVNSSHLTRYTERNPLIDKEFYGGRIIQFKVPGVPQTAHGYEATLLIDICNKYLEARVQGLLDEGSQLKLAAQAEIITRACAKVGIIALIDEATGFQKARAKNSLQLKLQAFIADEMQDWAKMFQDEFWIELARLEGISYSPRNRPIRWGRYVMMFVYDAIDPDVGKWLRDNNPDPHFLKNHHQWLKKFGRERMDTQIKQVVAVMRLCNDMEDFKRKFRKAFKNMPLQLAFDDIEWNSANSPK